MSNVNPERVIETLKLERKENKELRKRLEKEIQLKSGDVDQDLASDFNMIMSEQLGKMTPFMKLFWEQQKQISNIKSLSSIGYYNLNRIFRLITDNDQFPIYPWPAASIKSNFIHNVNSFINP